MMIVVRVDANDKIGAGHFTRCVTLAICLKKSNLDIVFLCRNLGNKLQLILYQEGIRYIELPSSECFDPVQDADHTCAALKSNLIEPDLVIVDHYMIAREWECRVKSVCNRMMVIDDLANRKHECDLLLDQNYVVDYKLRYDDLVPYYCKKLLGPHYVLLRDEFRGVHNNNKKTGFSIFVYFGGADIHNETKKVLCALGRMCLDEISVSVVVGSLNPNVDELKHICSRYKNYNYYYNISNISEVMQMADLAIGAAGTAIWERCSMSLPSIVITISDNQQDIAQAVSETEAIIYLGKSEDVSEYDIKQSIVEVMENKMKLKKMSAAARNLVDGEGVARVSDEVLSMCFA
ncbi:MAG TPA: UDP-2,4-diacetamido-2,4,6-trideoxy-beta-L-altropyranose hydrolase [Bacteroidetes bacterium]|nr:UDP-2,4-diacetamido-2,4,6-trideoxy-beta-L-altropyranose hydrolase [Bacteroidota bacterium]